MCIKVMVVDDELDIELLFRQKFRKELKNQEFDFIFAFSGEKALEYLESMGQMDIVLILSDINMPGMSGIELLKILKEKYSDLKVFMITAYGDEKNFQLSQQYGADKFINKPINFSELKNDILSFAKD